MHYFSPEHAKGVATGEKSDLYSLGIVLYQMLTGRLPFLGESPISVALKHLQEHFEEPRSVNPMIPQSVENIILKSMRKNPGERYQSAKEMLHDLETCLLPERRMESKLSFIDEEDEDSTRIVPAIKPQVSSSARGGSKLSRDAQGDSDREEAASKSIWFKPVLWVSLTVFLLLAMAGVVWYVNKTFTVPDVTVPNVINLSEEDAVRTLQDKGLEVGDVKREYKEGFDEGIVYEQSRPDGAQVKEGAIIDLKVSIVKPPEKMLSLIGNTYDEAVAQLVAAGVDEDRITKSEEFSEMEVGKVIAQDPDAKADYDPSTDSIVLKVSKGVKEFNMPSLIDKTQEEAEATIKELGLKLAKDGIKTEPSFEYEAGKVIGQWPFAPNSLATPGTEMVLTVSSGYPPEAIKYTFEVPAAPVEEGKNSKIRIVYGDARGDNKEWGTKTINTTQTFAVELVLAPNKNGAVSVIRDGELFDTYLVSYIDAKQGTVPVPQLPGSSVEENSYNDWEEEEMENPDTGWIDNGAVAQAVKDNKSKNNGKGNGKGKDKDKDKDKGYK
ncbi:Serine/threonine-protein kinase PrkC [compost metagenome]